MNESLHAFRDAIRAAGLEPPDVIEPGRFHRFPGLGKSARNRAGWCKLFDCGTAGSFGDFSADFAEDWHAARDVSLTSVERKARVAQAQEARALAARQRDVTQAQAAEKALRAWGEAELASGEHRYLQDKGIKPHGLRTDGKDLLIPLCDGGGTIHSLQRITPDGSKCYLSGGAIKEHWI